ncbi:MAG: PHP domain-containing protein [Bacillota bacterium]|nr:PHP domain-containing protein [Bacillota bacterium]
MLYYDLHIHSCLSPCAQDDMTPQNVCGMARLKGLDVIALTDHNSGGNLVAFSKAAWEYGLLFIPGMELCTAEEVHILAYFQNLDDALLASEAVRSHLPKKKNKPDFFGRQLLVDEKDQPCGEEDALLIGALDLSLEETLALIRSCSGIAVPAHVNRGYGMIYTLGFIPQQAGFKVVEQGVGEAPIKGMKCIHNSDAHDLGAISERENALLADDLDGVLTFLREGRTTA